MTSRSSLACKRPTASMILENGSRPARMSSRTSRVMVLSLMVVKSLNQLQRAFSAKDGRGNELPDRLGQREQHGKRFRGLHGVTQVGRHVKQIARLQEPRLTVQAEFAGAGQNLNYRLLR